jgi:hypothetical protein
MAHFDLQRSREQTAREQVGRTRVSRKTAWLLSLALLLLISLVPLAQQIQDIRDYQSGERGTWLPQAGELFAVLPDIRQALRDPELSLPRRVLAANRVLLAAMDRLEDDLEDASLLGHMIRPRMQSVLARLGVGNEQAYIGDQGWLFYRPGVDYVTGPGFLHPARLAARAVAGDAWRPAPRPDPRQALTHWHEQLQARDIALVVVPTPVKPMIHPEMFAPGMNPDQALNNPSFARLRQDLEQAGILVFDPAPTLMRAKQADQEPHIQYLATDTHWQPRAMQNVARELAAFLDSHALLPPKTPTGYRTRTLDVAQTGDIAAMLDLPADQRLFPPQDVQIRQVLDERGDLWRPDTDADILVLGDSFSNIFSLQAMGWGESAGFAEHLSLALDRPVDRIARNADGAHATREILARELSRGRDRLAGKKVVVYQFAARELAVGDWKILDMKLGDPPPNRFFQPAPGQTVQVSGVVAEVSPVPRPGSVPYADHVLSLHLVDLSRNGALLDDPQAVVYMWGMRDNEWTRAARLRPGDEVSLDLRSWADVANRYEGFNRSELDDFALQLEEPTWGEIPE